MRAVGKVFDLARRRAVAQPDRKLVGAAGQGSFGDKGLEPGKETQLGSCLIHLPKDKYKEIKFYEAVIYETDVAPKKK